MLISLREHAAGFFAKLLLILLIASFALWGIGDIFRDGERRQILATIDDQEITVAEYLDVLRLRKQNIRQMLGADYTPELMKQLGIEKLALREMVNFVLLEKETKALGIYVDDTLLAKQIHNNPTFRNETGQFDSSLFKRSMRSLGITEKYYLNKLSNETAANLLTTSLTGNHIVPEALINQLYKLNEEMRSADIYMLPQRITKAPKAPGDAVLREHYEQSKSRFTAPEYRSLHYTTIELSKLHSKTVVSDSDINTYYEENIDNFTKPEEREIEQLLYSSTEEAEKASTLLAKGLSMAQAAEKVLPLNSEVSMGRIAQDQLPEEARDVVFSLEKSAISSVTETSFGWHIFKVKEIYSKRIETIDSVKKSIRAELTDLQAEEELYQLANVLEDQVAGGATLKEAAESLGLVINEVPAIDKTGRTDEGQAFRLLPSYDNFLEAAFSQEQGERPTLMPGGDNAYFMVEVKEITPERVKPLDEVRAQVIKSWQKQERVKNLEKTALELAEGMRTDRKATQDRMRLLGIQSFSSGILKRSSKTLAANSKLKNLPVPERLVDSIFRLKQGDSTDAYRLYNGDYVIAVVKNITAPPAASTNDATRASLAEIRERTKSQYDKEIEEQYMQYLRKKYSVSVNIQLFQAVTAGE